MSTDALSAIDRPDGQVSCERRSKIWLHSRATSMCNRFTLRSRLNRILQDMDIEGGPEYASRFNISPTQTIPIIRSGDNGKPQCVLVRWGLVPSWATDLKKLPAMFNARSETLSSKPSFRTAFKKRRCLIPADGW